MDSNIINGTYHARDDSPNLNEHRTILTYDFHATGDDSKNVIPITVKVDDPLLQLPNASNSSVMVSPEMFVINTLRFTLKSGIISIASFKTMLEDTLATGLHFEHKQHGVDTHETAKMQSYFGLKSGFQYVTDMRDENEGDPDDPDSETDGTIMIIAENKYDPLYGTAPKFFLATDDSFSFVPGSLQISSNITEVQLSMEITAYYNKTKLGVTNRV